MKRNMIIAAGLAMAGVATYLLRRNMSHSGSVENGIQNKPSNHLTNAFSKAKKHAMSAE